jgi:hypothetical protein
VPTFRTAEVTEILSQRHGLQRVAVRVPVDGGATTEEGRAYALTELVGEVAVGDRVVCNTTAVELGLGTGGWHVVHWNLSRSVLSHPGPDHVMKLRYTSLQFDAGTSELAHPDLAEHLDGTPVVACLVHSQVGVVAAALKRLRPDLRVAYVMTDGAALPLALSDLVADLRERSLLDVTVTAGHAFGGDLEAVSVPSGLGLARRPGSADVVVVGMGPGVVGTGTTLGNSAVEAAWALDAGAARGGTPVLAVRASDADGRDRHRGVSHHTATVARFASCRPWVAAVPPEAADLPGVRRVDVPATDDVPTWLDELGLRITTMGRDHARDPLFFRAAGAAARVAVMAIEGRLPGSSGAAPPPPALS